MIDTQPREYTKEEVREMFLTHVNGLIKYWSQQGKSVEDACSGVAFSILTALDGCSMGLPGFIVAPYPDETDKEYHISNGENWFPDNTDSNIKCDIGGGLHELLHKYK